VLERRQLAPHPILIVEVELGDGDALAVATSAST